MRKIQGILFCGLALGILQGCATSESGNIATVEIHPSYTLTGNSSNRVECTASFSVGGSFGTQLRLTAGDVVSCSDGTTTVPMTEVSVLGMISYKAVGLTYGTGKTYSFIFARPQKTGESFTSTASLPDPITITGPAAGTRIEKASPWNLVWSAATSKSLDIWISYSTLSQSGGFSLTGRTDSSGTSIVQPIEMSSLAPLSGDITATIKMTRTKDGTQDPALSGRGGIKSEQTAETAVTFY